MTTGSTTVFDTRGIPVYSLTADTDLTATADVGTGKGEGSALETVIVFDGGGAAGGRLFGAGAEGGLPSETAVTFGIVDRSVCNVICDTLNVTDVFLWIAPAKSLHETIIIH